MPLSDEHPLTVLLQLIRHLVEPGLDASPALVAGSGGALNLLSKQLRQN
jgi:hypothetical protein